MQRSQHRLELGFGVGDSANGLGETRDAQRVLYSKGADRIAAGNIEHVIEASRRIAPPDPFGPEWHDRMERNLRTADHQQMAHVWRGAATADFPRDQVRNIAGVRVDSCLVR